MLAEVQYRKWNGEKTFLIVDAGMNDLIRPAFYESFHFLWPVRSADAPPHRGFGGDPAAVLSRLAPVDVVGPICESSDCFAKERLLPPLGRGDLLAFFSAGAYGFTMASSYNSRPRPAEVLVDGDRWRIIRARETWEDLVRGETV